MHEPHPAVTARYKTAPRQAEGTCARQDNSGFKRIEKPSYDFQIDYEQLS